MADEVDPTNSTSAGQRPRDPEAILAERRAVSAGDVLPLGPNFVATMVGFLCLMAAPSVCLQVLAALWEEEAIGENHVAALFVVADVEETLVIAAVGAVSFLVVGAILQAWQYQRPFRSRWPVFLAFPIAWGLLVPEAWMRGGSLLSGALVGTAIALAFSIQWATLVYLREAMD
jgi:hypothetical protein